MNKAGAYGDDQGLTKWVDMQAVRAPGLNVTVAPLIRAPG